MEKELELYIHIPFCVKKCAYCDFLSGPQNADTIDRYVEALVREILAYKGTTEGQRGISTLFFGGGTPSILNPVQMKRIFRALREVFCIEDNAEITIEANPGTVTEEKLKTYRELGINRISFGLQSANNEELKLLGRVHTYEEFLDSYSMARACGFENINVDLISAIPKQTLESWEDTLNKVVTLQPEHISAYSLIIEEDTPFAEIYGAGKSKEADLPSEEEERRIYRRTEEILSRAGYRRYETSNYAKAGKECKHNLGYWERKDYLGLGLGAASLVNNVRYKNIDDLKRYISCNGIPSAIQVDREELTVTQQKEETIFLGLRKKEGISLAEFEKTFGRTVQACYGSRLIRMQEECLLEIEE